MFDTERLGLGPAAAPSKGRAGAGTTETYRRGIIK